ncbi:MAG: TIGR04283 family arsenosugar biosynthesis glycosyltransferase [bacterium]|nr:TIGR04283 family arsenosugar biosynthesis glycosyltransferase [bacterium]
MKISLIIACYNEAQALPLLLQEVQKEPPFEVLVADGGSEDGSQSLVEGYPDVQLVTCPKGRARQFNEAAQRARGDLLVFLHADSRLSPGWAAEARRLMGNPKNQLGAYRFKTDQQGLGMSLLAWGVRLRCWLFHLPYGDQGLILRRTDFNALGGFGDMPLLDDLDLVQRAKQRGRVVLSALPLITSARRWRKGGLWQVTWINQKVLWLYWLGKDPKELKELYQSMADKEKTI